jgi:hypothetical protein
VFARWGVLLLGTLAAAAVIGSSAGARTQLVTQPVKVVPGIDLSSRAGIVKYLHSLGLDPKGVVIQRSSHNYAGPSCPGFRWTCTTAKHVVQISYRGNESHFECTASTGGSQTPPDTCNIVQIATDGTNEARCVEQTDAPAVTQQCVIHQENVAGDNRAEVRQKVDANDGSAQDATQYAAVDQQNGTGANWVHIDEDIKQSVKDTDSSGAQSQEAHQNVDVTQHSDSGDNTARVDQSQNQDAKAEKDTVMQGQNAANNGINTYAGIDQTSTSGQNAAHLNQSTDQDAKAKKKNTSTQTQGSPSGGIQGHFNQFSSGLSTVDGQQREHQTAKAEGKKTSNTTQYQYGPQWFGSQQRGNPNDTYDIDQRSDQKATNPALQQDQQVENCDTDGVCTATESLTQNGERHDNSCTDSSCHIGQTWSNTSEGSFGSSCVGFPEGETIAQETEGTNFCPSPPPPPPPPGPPNGD